MASLYLKYYANNVSDINSTIDVIKDGKIYGESYNLPLSNINNTGILELLSSLFIL